MSLTKTVDCLLLEGAGYTYQAKGHRFTISSTHTASRVWAFFSLSPFSRDVSFIILNPN